jgi:hypothetical protein
MKVSKMNFGRNLRVQVIKECATKKSPLKAGLKTSGRRLVLGDDRLPLLSLYREFRNPAEIENLLLKEVLLSPSRSISAGLRNSRR